MFLVRKKTTLKSLEQKPLKPIPILLYGYGGFGVSEQPAFSAVQLTFMNNLGGMYVVANIRGGGELGEEWHTNGILDKKQNSFDDFIGAAEYLIKQGYTDHEHLTIQGGSNGGLLVTACANQRPDLFAAVLGEVPVTDMLRFQKFTIGKVWTTDYGNADDGDIDYMIKYSPLHTIKT